MTGSGDTFPIVATAQGAVSEDGRAVLIRIETVEYGMVGFALKLRDVHDFVTFLLRLVPPADGSDSAEERAYQPIPISGISAGELEDGNGCLGVTIGGRDLVFEMPLSAINEIGRTLMTASATGRHGTA
jgi:hypothetical protein